MPPPCRPLASATPSHLLPSLLSTTQKRCESTARRHRKLLALPNAPSYTPDTSRPTLIFNPPSSAPNVYHTPLKFLPKEDKRRQLYSAAMNFATATALHTKTSPIASPGTPLQVTGFLPPKPQPTGATTTSASASAPNLKLKLPTPVRQPYEKTYNLTPPQIAEIQKLRAEDPDKWTRVRLAERFGCSQFFVGMVAKNEGKAERVEAEHKMARERWGNRRRMAREDRVRRKESWGRDV